MRTSSIVLGLLALTLSTPAWADGVDPFRPRDAERLLSGARSLDGRATSAEDRAEQLELSAKNLELSAQELRAKAGTGDEVTRARLRAKADDLEVQAALRRAEANDHRTLARRARAEAKEIRELAKRRAAARSGSAPTGPTGTLTVVSATPCTLRIDGVVSGVTPVTSVRLPAGTHHLACETLGGATLTTRVAIGASTTQRVTLAPPTQAAAAPEPGFF